MAAVNVSICNGANNNRSLSIAQWWNRFIFQTRHNLLMSRCNSPNRKQQNVVNCFFQANWHIISNCQKSSQYLVWSPFASHGMLVHSTYTVCHLPCRVRTGIHLWSEHLSKVPDAIDCEHLPTQGGYESKLQSGVDPDEEDGYAGELPWDSLCRYYGYANHTSSSGGQSCIQQLEKNGSKNKSVAYTCICSSYKPSNHLLCFWILYPHYKLAALQEVQKNALLCVSH